MYVCTVYVCNDHYLQSELTVHDSAVFCAAFVLQLTAILYSKLMLSILFRNRIYSHADYIHIIYLNPLFCTTN